MSEKNINIIFSIVGLNNEIRKFIKNIKKLFLIFIDTQIEEIIKKRKK